MTTGPASPSPGAFLDVLSRTSGHDVTDTGEVTRRALAVVAASGTVVEADFERRRRGPSNPLSGGHPVDVMAAVLAAPGTLGRGGDREGMVPGVVRRYDDDPMPPGGWRDAWLG